MRHPRMRTRPAAAPSRAERANIRFDSNAGARQTADWTGQALDSFEDEEGRGFPRASMGRGAAASGATGRTDPRWLQPARTWGNDVSCRHVRVTHRSVPAICTARVATHLRHTPSREEVRVRRPMTSTSCSESSSSRRAPFPRSPTSSSTDSNMSIGGAELLLPPEGYALEDWSPLVPHCSGRVETRPGLPRLISRRPNN